MSVVSEAAVTLGRGYIRYGPAVRFKTRLVEHVNARLRDHPRRRTVRTAAGARCEVDTTDLISRYLYLFGVWEPNMAAWLSRRLRPGDGFIDIGANTGAFTLLAARLVGPTGTVVAIEACRPFLTQLEHNLHLTTADRAQVRTVHAAVSDDYRSLDFSLASAENLGANSIVPYDGETVARFTIDAQPLPVLLHPDEIAATRVVKIDVEGAEGQVVRGMEPLLDRLRPDAEIAIEITPARLAALGESVHELFSILAHRGFHPYHLVNNYNATSYPATIRDPAPAVRLPGIVDVESDVIFSRVDADRLA